MVRAGNRVDEEFACGGLLFSRHEVAQHDATDDLLAKLAGVDKVAAVVLVGQPRTIKPRVARIVPHRNLIFVFSIVIPAKESLLDP